MMPLLNTLSFSADFSVWWDKFFGALTSFTSITDVLDVLLVTLVVYALLVMLRKSQSIQIIKGAVLLIVFYLVVNVMHMSASKYLFDSVIGDILIILVVVFSKEIRQLLERLGQTKGFRIFSIFTEHEENETIDAINAVCRACASMSEDRVGSLIIFQRKSLLGDLTKQSVPIDCITTSEMLLSIFFPNAALHDGAIIIKDGRIVAARCVVPLRNEKEIHDHVGTRHRAALEVSLMSDAVVVVTSEETGIISVACDGELIRNLTDSELRSKLSEYLLSENNSENSSSKKSPFAKMRKGDSK